MNYCPRCGGKLVRRTEGGRDRPACGSDGCGFMHFGDYSIGCGAVVLRDNKALLIQRGLDPGKGSWQIPGGYVEVEEELHAAVEREVLEETGVVAHVVDVVGFRHAAGVQRERPNANIYVIFRLSPVSGEPRFDGIETMAAGYYSLEEMTRMDRVQALSVWGVTLAMDNMAKNGLLKHESASGLQRPGYSLFGLPNLNG